MTERDALHPQTLVQVRIALKDGNVDERYLGIGRCHLVEGGAYGVTCLNVKKKRISKVVEIRRKYGPVLDEESPNEA